MKMYRILTKQDNGCYSPGFYHEDKEFLKASLEALLLQYPDATETFFLEEVELNNLTPIEVKQGATDGTQPPQSTETGKQDSEAH